MFNRCHCMKCCCPSDNNANLYETSCDNVSNVLSDFDNSKDCGCGFEEEAVSVFPDNFVFGQSYVPVQYMDKTFTPCVGLKKGTLFPELVSPYSPCQSLEENAFIKAKNTIGEGCNKC